jgi:hypothetical protein
MSLGLWPEAVPFDPDDGTALSELRKHFDATALPPAVLLVAARSLRDSAWAARAAIGLARALAGTRTIVLADLDFEQASLHDALGAANGEGVADALLFGASLERVTLHPAGEPFEFVPAGAYAPEPDELMAHSSWARLLAELAARDALLLGWAPLGTRGLDSIAERIPAVVLLSEESDVTGTAARLPESIRIEGIVRPASPPPPPPVEPPAEPEPEAVVPTAEPVVDEPADARIEGFDPTSHDAAADVSTERPRSAKDEAREALKAELRARQQATEIPSAPPAPQPVAKEAAVRTRPAEPAGQPANRKGILILASSIGVLVIISLLVISYIRGRNHTLPNGQVVQPAGPAEPAGEILGYSVAIESYDRMAAAVARADSLGMAEPGVTFYVAPFTLDSATWYRVLAGPLVDSLAAAATMQGLVDRGLKVAASQGDVRSTPLAFEIGRFETREEAEQRMNELKTEGVPSYVVEVPYTQGPSRYHLYAGAYSGPSEAMTMRGLLRGAGIPDTLVLRVGRNSP